MKSKCIGKLRAGVLLLLDNATVHTAQFAVAEVANSGFESLLHSPNSPDFPLSDFFLLGRHFETNYKVISA